MKVRLGGGLRIDMISLEDTQLNIFAKRIEEEAKNEAQESFGPVPNIWNLRNTPFHQFLFPTSVPRRPIQFVPSYEALTSPEIAN